MPRPPADTLCPKHRAVAGSCRLSPPYPQQTSLALWPLPSQTTASFKAATSLFFFSFGYEPNLQTLKRLPPKDLDCVVDTILGTCIGHRPCARPSPSDGQWMFQGPGTLLGAALENPRMGGDGVLEPGRKGRIRDPPEKAPAAPRQQTPGPLGDFCVLTQSTRLSD